MASLVLSVRFEDRELLDSYIEQRSRELSDSAADCGACEPARLCSEHQQVYREMLDDVCALALGMAKVKVDG